MNDASARLDLLAPPRVPPSSTLLADAKARTEAGTKGGGAVDTADSGSLESVMVVQFGARCRGGGTSGSSFSSAKLRFFGPPTAVALRHEVLEHTGRTGQPRRPIMERLLGMVMQE